MFHIDNIPKKPHKHCKCGTVPLRLHNTFAQIDERLDELEGKLGKIKKNYISSKYGDRVHPITGKKDFHEGTDFAVPEGTPLPSPVNGKVSRNDYTSGNGNRVAIIDKTGVEHHFYHMNERSYLQVGDKVEVDNIVGYSGNSGHSKGAHLHYEARDTKSGKGYPDNVVAPSQENVDYFNDYFQSYFN